MSATAPGTMTVAEHHEEQDVRHLHLDPLHPPSLVTTRTASIRSGDRSRRSSAVAVTTVVGRPEGEPDGGPDEAG